MFLAVKSIDGVLAGHRCDCVRKQELTVLLRVDRESHEVTQCLEARSEVIAERVRCFGVNTGDRNTSNRRALKLGIHRVSGVICERAALLKSYSSDIFSPETASR